MNKTDGMPEHTCEIPDGLDDCDACRLAEIDEDIKAGRNIGPISPALLDRITEIRAKAVENRERRAKTEHEANALLSDIDDYLREVLGEGLPHDRTELQKIVMRHLNKDRPHFRFTPLGQPVPCSPDAPGAMPLYSEPAQPAHRCTDPHFWKGVDYCEACDPTTTTRRAQNGDPNTIVPYRPDKKRPPEADR